MDGIVVAAGGSAGERVLDWAAREAAGAGLPLTVLHVAARRADAGRTRAALEEQAAAACARTGADVAVEVVVETTGGVADALCGVDAPLLVLGRRTRRRSPGRVGTAVLERARVPVTVVPHALPDGTGAGPVVAGVDGSGHASTALAHAAAVARRRDAVLEAVLAWQITTLSPLPDKEWGYVPPVDDYERYAAELLDRAVTAAGVALPEGRLVRSVVHAPPGRALLEAAEHAERLVVGHRGRSGVDRVLLGSVSRGLVVHAPCPVTVVR